MVATAKSVQLNMRVYPAQRQIIARAAEARHKTVTDFVVDAATKAAEDVLLNQRAFVADDEQHEELLRIMDSPVSENPMLQRTLSRLAPWER